MKMHQKSNRIFRPFSILAVLAAGLAAGQVMAGPLDSPPSVTVNYADLNLANPAGVRILHQRIETAARAVCGDDFNSEVLELRDAARVCYKTATREALARVKTGDKLVQN